MAFIVFVFLIAVFLVAGISVRSGFSQEGSAKQVTSEKVAHSSRGEIAEMLRQVEVREAPVAKFGAMCYEMAAPPEYAQYICPVDGEKSAYKWQDDYQTYSFVTEVLEMRRFLSRVNAVTDLASFILDESRMCHICAPHLKNEERGITLLVLYPDGRQHRYEKVRLEDMRILLAFFEEKLSYPSERDSEVPLKGKMDQIKKLLGLDDLTDKL